MGAIFYLIGPCLAGYAGYSGFHWYFIFISSVIMALGYFVIRAAQIKGGVIEYGMSYIPKALFYLVLGYSIITALVYFIASLLN